MRTLKTTMLAVALCACGTSGGGGGGGGGDVADEGVPTLPDAGGGSGGAGGGGSGGEGGTTGGTGGDKSEGGAGGAGPDLGVRFACNDGQDNDADGAIDLADPGCSGPEDNDETDGSPDAQCSDGLDNDGDRWPDLLDPDCTSEADPSEMGENAATACHNELDDDADGWVDFPADPGCRAAGDDDEADGEAPTCFNEQDDDADGLTDYPLDPGCQGRGDMNEADPAEAPACTNGADDDADGQTDYPADPGCESAADADESGACGPGHDAVDLNAWLADHTEYDGTLVGGTADFAGSCGGAAGPERIFQYRLGERVGALTFSTDHTETVNPTVVYVRSGCLDPVDVACNRGAEATPGTVARVERPDAGVYFVVVDTSSMAIGPGAFRLTVETTPAPACDNARDDDADGRLDLADPGCTGIDDNDETDEGPTACADGLDNDNDGQTDYPADPDCLAAGGQLEGPLCGAGVQIVEVAAPGGQYQIPLGVGDSVVDSRCGVGVGVETVLAVAVQDASRVIVNVAADDEGDFQVSLRDVCDDGASEVNCDVGEFGRTLSFDQRTEGAGVLYFIVEAAADGFNFPSSGVTATVTVESLVTECNDEVDNDADALVDLADPGCERLNDTAEADPVAVPACFDGEDNDADGQIDFPADDGCIAAGDRSEEVTCDLTDEVLEIPPGGGLIPVTYGAAVDFYDLSCAGSGPDAIAGFTLDRRSEVIIRTLNNDYDTVLALLTSCEGGGQELDCDDDGGGNRASLLHFDALEAGTYFVAVTAFSGDPGLADLEVSIISGGPTACNDAVDNDADALVDAADPGCTGALDADEADPEAPAACSDGQDNDADGATDYPADPDCIAAGTPEEGTRCLDHRALIEVDQAGGTFFADMTNGADLVQLSCDDGDLELPFVLTLTEPSNVRVTSASRTGEDAGVALSIRTGCGEADAPDEELGCVGSFVGTPLVARALQPGRYYVFAQNGAFQAATNIAVNFEIASLVRACNDGVDNDEDALVDAADPGCAFGMDARRGRSRGARRLRRRRRQRRGRSDRLPRRRRLRLRGRRRRGGPLRGRLRRLRGRPRERPDRGRLRRRPEHPRRRLHLARGHPRPGGAHVGRGLRCGRDGGGRLRRDELRHRGPHGLPGGRPDAGLQQPLQRRQRTSVPARPRALLRDH